MFQKIKESLKSNLFKHISTVFLWNNIAKFFGIITTIILIRLLPKEDYALYTFFWAAAMFFAEFVSSGIDMAYVRFAAEEYSVKKKMPNDIFVFSILLCFAIFLILSPMIMIFRKQLSLLMFRSTLYSKPIVLGFIAAIGLFFIAMGSRYYQVQEKYKIAGFLGSLQKILTLLFLFIIITSGKLNFLKVAVVQLVAILSFGVLFIASILRNDLLKEKMILNLGRFITLFKVSFWLIFYFVCFSLFNHLDVFMISRIMASTDLANYGVAFKYYCFLMLMFPAIKTVLKVRTSKIDMIESIEKQKIFFKKWIKIAMLIFIPAIILIVLFSDYFMNLLNGTRYMASILPFKILAIGAMCGYIFSPITDIFRAIEKINIGFIAS